VPDPTTLADARALVAKYDLKLDEAITEIDDLVAGVLGKFTAASSELRRRAISSNARAEGGIGRLAASLRIVQRAADRFVELQIVFRNQRAGILQSVVGIRHRRPDGSRTDRSARTSEIASVTISGALAGARQTAALDPGQMLADRIDLADRARRSAARPGSPAAFGRS